MQSVKRERPLSARAGPVAAGRATRGRPQAGPRRPSGGTNGRPAKKAARRKASVSNKIEQQLPENARRSESKILTIEAHFGMM